MEVLRLAGWRVNPVEVLPDETGQVHTDMPRIEAVKSRLQPASAVVALGSGTICDISKHACYLYEQETSERLPFVVYQTANSVSAYTSNMAPTFVEGVKRTLPSRYPDALVCDLETLRDAPREMTVAGVGDLLAAFVSFPDWLLANHLGLDPSYSPLAQELMGPLDTNIYGGSRGDPQRLAGGHGNPGKADRPGRAGHVALACHHAHVGLRARHLAYPGPAGGEP